MDLGLVESCKVDFDFGPAGAFAEYCAAPEALVAKFDSAQLPFEQAAGLPLAGLTSYQALFTGAGGATDFQGGPLGNLQQGSKLLILGGASATGAYGIQLGVAKGVSVTATASENKQPDGKTKLDACAELGASVINYKTEDWAEKLAGQGLYMIYDCVGSQEDLAKAGKVLKPGGKFFSIANFGPEGVPEGVVFQNFLLKANATDLQELVGLAQGGKLRVAVDTVVPLDGVQDALRKSASWASAGKIVIKVA